MNTQNIILRRTHLHAAHADSYIEISNIMIGNDGTMTYFMKSISNEIGSCQKIRNFSSF